MSNYLLKQFVKGIALRGEAANIDENVEGSLFHNSTEHKILSYIESAVREIVTDSQIQTLTNKTINATDNLIVVTSTNPNLSSTELNNALSELQTDLDGAKQSVTDHLLDTTAAHAASAVSVSPSGNLTSTTAQAALVELQLDIDSASGNLASHIAASDPHPQYETSVESQAKVDAHANRVDNPHSVTKSQVGLGSVDNTSDADKPISNATQLALNNKANLSHTQTASTITDFSEAVDDRVNSLIVAGSNISAVYNDVANTLTISSTVPVITDHTALSNIGTNTHDQIDTHIASTSNPHGVTKSQVGLSNVDNTSDLNKPISTATQIALDLKIDESREGQALGIATLDATGKVPASQLPSYVDDVVEVASFLALPATGETSKIYITLDNNKTYRWSGSVYVEVSASSDPVWGSITGTLSNQSDLQTALSGKANITHTHVSADITDFNESVDDRVNSLIVAGSNISATYDDLANTLTIASTVSVITDHTALSNIGTNSHADIDSHISSTSNPHSVTKSQVGLSNVDNTSDLNKPVSTATQTALNGKADLSHTHVASDITDLSEAIDDRINSTLVAGSNVTLTYDDLANTLTIAAAGGGSGGATTLDELTDVSAASPTNGQALVYNSTSSQWEAQTLSSGGGATDLNGLNDVTLSSPSTGQVLKYGTTQWENSSLNKSDVGLSNVDNTSDLNKPISTATQLGLDGKANVVHTHISSDITDFSESVDDRVSSLLVAGSNITLTYNDVSNTLVIDSAGAPASTSAERLITNVYNGSGSLIPKMSVVYVNGAQGDQAKIVLAQANTESTSSKTYGLVVSDIANTASGVVVEQGRLDNLNTDIAEWTEGDVLWLSPTIAGGITTVKPSAPNHAVFIGYLVRKHQSVGAIQVSIQNGYELQELHNVAINGISDGQVIKYEAATSLWKNQTLIKSDVGLANVDNTSDADKPISDATQTALDGKANTSHTHVAADITDFNSAVDARIPTIPSSIVSSVNGDSGPDIILDTDDVGEGSSNLYFTNERVDDRVNGLLVAGNGIALSYNDSANTLTVTATGVVAGASKYIRGFGFSGSSIPSGSSSLPVVITSNATIYKVKTYGTITSGIFTFTISKNGTTFHTSTISSSSVVSDTIVQAVLENDILTCVVSYDPGAVGSDFIITLELS